MIKTEGQYTEAYRKVCNHILRGTDESPECHELSNQIYEYQRARIDQRHYAPLWPGIPKC